MKLVTAAVIRDGENILVVRRAPGEKLAGFWEFPGGKVEQSETLQECIRFEYIQPGKPQQNAYVERFNRTVRYEWLSQYYWSSIQEVQDFATQWMWSYNHDRPHMALGGFTPKQHLAKAA
jgi:adenine-specific DNA glycosylase